MNADRQQIIALIERAILTLERNIASEELRRAQLGIDAPVEVEANIAHYMSEMERLEQSKGRIGANGGRVTSGERMEALSAQVSELLGGFQLINGTIVELRTCVATVEGFIGQIREGCPLFKPDMPEGFLQFVKPKMEAALAQYKADKKAV